jgi:hypothetical protein
MALGAELELAPTKPAVDGEESVGRGSMSVLF